MILGIVKSPKQEGYIKVHSDEDCLSPREWDNLSTMICFHRRYDLGDSKARDEFNPQDYNSFDEMIDDNFEYGDNYTYGDIILPLYLYDHSGITISTTPFSCPWDSGQLGFVFIRKETIIAQYGNDDTESREKALSCLHAEVEDYDNYLQGNCYGFIEYDNADEEVHSCWGYSGDMALALAEFNPNFADCKIEAAGV